MCEDDVDREYLEWKDGLLDAPCALCNERLHELDAVRTKAGLAHESCGERVYPTDHGDSRWPR